MRFTCCERYASDRCSGEQGGRHRDEQKPVAPAERCTRLPFDRHHGTVGVDRFGEQVVRQAC